MPTRSRGNVSIDFTNTINAETDLGISDGDTLDGNLNLDNHADTLILLEPGTYYISGTTGLSLTVDNVGIESSTQNRSDVTIEPLNSEDSVEFVDAGDNFPGNFYLGHVTFDRKDNWNGDIGICGKESGGWWSQQVLFYDIEFLGWKGESGCSITSGGFKNDDPDAQLHMETVIDTGPVQYGDYGGGGTTITIFHGDGSTGNYYYKDLNFQNHNESGIYAGKAPGNVIVEDSYFAFCQHTAVRVTGEGSRVSNVSVLQDMDQMHPGNEISRTDGGMNFNRGFWAQADDQTKAAGLIEDCDIVYGRSAESGESAIAGIFIADDVGYGTIRNCRVLVNDEPTCDNVDPLRIQNVSQTAVSPYDIQVENCHLINRNGGKPVSRVDERDGTTFDNCCIEGTGDGIEFNGTQDARVSDTNFNVDGQNIVTNGGADVTTTGNTSGSSCTEPDLSSWTQDSGGGGGGGGGGEEPEPEPEQTYATDFTTYTTGGVPSDWTIRWHSVENDWNVNSIPSNVGGQVLELDTTNPKDRRAISWDGVGQARDTDILGLLRYPEYDGDGIGWTRIHSRGGGDESGETSYFAGIGYSADGGNYELQIGIYNNGSFDILENSEIIDYSGEWIWIRFRTNGTNLRSRLWQYGQEEPNTWDIGISNSDLSEGWVGVGAFDHNLQSWDYVSVGVGGVSAPMPVDNTGVNVFQTVNSGVRRTVNGINQTRPIKLNVETNPATDIGEETATLNMELLELDAFYESDVFFNYRQTGDGTWDVSASQTVGGPTTYSMSVSSLNADSEYEFQGVAEGIGGQGATDTGNTLTFTTEASILSNGLQNRWNFEDDTDPSVAVDSFGTNDGTINGTTISSTDSIIGDNSIVLDGIDDNVTGMSSVVPDAADFTIMGWVNLPASPNSEDTTLLVDGGLRIYSYMGFRGAVRVYHDDEAEIMLGSDIRGAGETHIAVRRSGDSWSLFENGVEVATATAGDMTLGSDLVFGSTLSNDGWGEGSHDDIRFYNRALSDTEINDISNKVL